LISVYFWISVHTLEIAKPVFSTAKETAAKSGSLNCGEYREKTNKAKLEEITRYISSQIQCVKAST